MSKVSSLKVFIFFQGTGCVETIQNGKIDTLAKVGLNELARLEEYKMLVKEQQEERERERKRRTASPMRTKGT